MARIKLREFSDKVITSDVKTAFWISWLAFIVVVGFTFIFFKYKGDFLRSIFVEAHGILFDLFVIATFILWLNKKAEKRRNIQRWQEEIDDYRGWDEKEAAFRIAGNIKRLNRNGITEICLRDCFLKGANLELPDLGKAILTRANLEKVDFGDAYLDGADLRGTNLEVASLRDASFLAADLSGARGLTIEQLSQVKTLYQATSDPELWKQIKEKYPHLLEMPKFPKEEK